MPKRPNIVQQSVFENNNTYNMAVESDKTSIGEDALNMDTCIDDCDSHFASDGTDMTPKMGRSGGGRRKQSKPIRVFLDMETEQTPTTQPTDAPLPEGKENMEHLTKTSELVMDLDETFNCDLCNDSFQTQSSLTDHIQSVHEIRGEEEDQEMNYPTKYHRLGSELQLGASLNNGKPDLEAAPSELQHSPQNQNQDESNGSDAQGPGSADGSRSSRIFHQDAYCELCDREFCNKYFLKTHKANKHGIYDNSPTTTNSSCSISASSLSSFPPLPRLEEIPAMSLPVSLPPQPMTVADTGTVIPQPITSTSPASQASTAATSTKSSVNSRDATPSKPNPDMEDYCEICQKHFCNKYYLKKHKHDVHGIVPENSLLTGNKRGRPATLGSSHPSSTSNMCTSSSTHTPLLIPHNSPISSASMMNGAGNMPGLNSMANFMFINPFAQPVLIQAQPSLQPTLQPLPAGLVPQSLAGLPQVPQPPNTPDASKNNMPSTTSPSSVQLPTDPLRALGGQGQEVTCELCRKEFCNKYFLKLHKAHKHGIYYDDITGMGPVLLPGLGAAPDGLNLGGPEPGETTSDCRDKCTPKSTPEKLKSEPMEEICEICHKEFSNRYSLRVHLINAHNVKPHDFDISSISSSITQEIMKAEKLNGGQNMQGTMFGNMIAAKLADRVMCDICNKEVCNKYFLKTHKIKVHGVDPSQLDKDKEEKMSPEKVNPLNLSASANNVMMEPQKQESVVRPNDEELLKMGIDPEAYCEICKKEFCSKYFLKTHKLNIHGIKTDYRSDILVKPPLMVGTIPGIVNTSIVSGMVNTGIVSGMVNTGIVSGIVNTGIVSTPEKKPLTTMAPVITPNSSTRSSPSLGPILQIPAPPQLHSDNSNNSTESGKWKWKEPVNATRIMCEICSKELCNKYFLKTHLLNKHGIYYDVVTGQASAPTNIPGMPCQMSSVKEEIKNVNESSVASTGSASDAANLPLTGIEGDKSDNSNENVISAKTWQIPPNGKEDHTKERKGEDNMDEMLKTTDGEFYIQKCDICGMIFGEKVTLQLHMIRDHQGQVTVHAEDSGQGEYKPSLTTSLGLSLKRKYQRSVKKKAVSRGRIRRFGVSVVKGIGEKVKSALVNHVQNHQGIKKKYRCAHCQERFYTRGLCQSHIRSEHGHVKLTDPAEDSQGSQNRPVQKPLRSRQLTQTNGNHNPTEPMETSEEATKIPTPKLLTCPDLLNKKMSDNSQVTMQSFTLQEEGVENHFAASVVYLPVFQKISEPLSTTFTLTPTQP